MPKATARLSSKPAPAPTLIPAPRPHLASSAIVIGPEPATAFYERLLRATRLGGDGAAPDPVARSQAFERLWRYVFVDAAGG